MTEMVDARRSAETKEERRDLFSGLLDAADGDLDGGVAITDQELISTFRLPYRVTLMKRVPTRYPGNMFVFLLAGHEVQWCHPILPLVQFEPSSTVDDSPYTLLHVRPIGTLPRRARALVSGNHGDSG